MGVYTWVGKECCGEELQFQASHPVREYGNVDVNEVPVPMAQRLDGKTQECPICMRVWRISIKPHDYKSVPMEIVCENEDEIGGISMDDHLEEPEDSPTEARLKAIERQLGLRK